MTYATRPSTEPALETSVELSKYEQSRLSLVRTSLSASAELPRAIDTVAEIGARTLDVHCVRIWMFDETTSELHCRADYARDSGSRTSGGVRRIADVPTYWRTLHARKVLAASDARGDPRTRELSASYFEPRGVVSVLDAPVFRDGTVVGVVSHEHFGKQRSWTDHEIEFASSVADILTVLLERASRLAVEEQLRATRERIERMERKAALGRLTTGVAHDFNNVLVVTMLAIGEVKSIDIPEDLVEQLDELGAMVDHGKRLVKQLMSFAHEQPPKVGELDVGATLREMQPIFDALVGSPVELDVAGEQLWIRLDRAQLEQAVLSLVLNSVDASRLGAPILVRALRETSDGGCVVAIEVIDQSCGISPELRERIFEPFFTTKRDGIGMGLSTVHRIVTNANGTVTVDSTVDKGSTFTLRFPAITKAQAK